MEGLDARMPSQPMDAEYNSLLLNQTWEVVKRLLDLTVITCKWMYKLKEEQSPNGMVAPRYKARLVAYRFRQVEGIDYSETIAHTLKFTSVRGHLSVASVKDLPLYHMDSITAFPKEIRKNVLVEQQPGDK